MILSIIQVVLVLILVSLILLQAPGSDGISSFGGTQGINSMLSVGSSSSIITKMTTIVAAAFLINTLILVGVNTRDLHKQSLADKISEEMREKSKNEDPIPFNN